MHEGAAPGDAGQIGVFGGSFNPPHVGHVLACSFALSAWNLERVLVVPSFNHPFGKPLVAFEHRVQMLELALRHLGNSVKVSQVEKDLGGVSYTVETLRELTRRQPGQQLRLIVGSDILGETAKWYKFEEIEQIAPLLVIPRLGAEAATAGCYLPEVSSTDIRQQLRDRTSAGVALPHLVREYIQQHQLYS